MADERKVELENLLSRRDAAKEQVQRIKGRLEAAKKDRDTVEAECRQRGIDPHKIDSVIQQLQERYDKAVGDLSTRIEKAEKAITPFLED